MNDDLKDMLKISTSVGSDSRLVQGGGGNTSVKTDGGDLMYVKASGTNLGEMREGRGYRLVDVQKCIDIVEDASIRELPPSDREAEVLSRLKDCCVDELEGRPSVETSLHAMLGRCVVHTHPSVVNGLLCAQEGREALEELFGDMSPPYLYIGFCGAGYPLAYRMHGELQEYEDEHGCRPEVIFLENHGPFVVAEEADRALKLTDYIFRTIERAAERAEQAADLPEFSPPPPEQRRALVEEVTAAVRRFYSDLFGGTALVRFQDNSTVTDFLRLPHAAEHSQVGLLSPDMVVYCRERPVWVESVAEADTAAQKVTGALEAAEAGEDTPLCLLVGDLGLFCAAPTAKLLDAVSNMMRASLESMFIAAFFGGPRPLDDETIHWLRVWEVERFRRQVAIGRDEAEEAGGESG